MQHSYFGFSFRFNLNSYSGIETSSIIVLFEFNSRARLVF